MVIALYKFYLAYIKILEQEYTYVVQSFIMHVWCNNYTYNCRNMYKYVKAVVDGKVSTAPTKEYTYWQVCIIYV